ncbi:hypothetical protein Z946_3988 [Sulfitobacter noctilucicola]|nr:hypothetical protein Z946_3988 [Sulfitobacter noctilucicola]
MGRNIHDDDEGATRAGLRTKPPNATTACFAAHGSDISLAGYFGP